MGFRKRAIDIIISSFFIFFIGPLLVAIIVLLKIKDPKGKIFYKHKRLGKNGIQFNCYKFRSMYSDSDKRLKDLFEKDKNALKEFQANYKLKNDPRIIPGIGDFLRRSSFDEFPQLFNIIKGEMSLVGPRPIVESEKEKYKNILDLLFKAKPGLTGLWQISGRSDLKYNSRVNLDRFYIENQSIGLDFKIIALTFETMFEKKGAY